MLRRLSSSSATRGGGLAIALGVVACTAFEPGTDELPEPESEPALEVAVAAGQPAGPGPDWGCLGDPEVPPALVPTPAAANRMVLSLQVLSLASGLALPGISVRACAQRDVACGAPLTEDIPVDAQGWLDVPLYEGFDGFLELRGESIVPTLLFHAEPLRPDRQVSDAPLGLVERDLLPALTAAAGSPQEAGRGIVYLRAFDCRGQSAPGVTFSIDRSGVPWYFVGGLPSTTAVETAESGLGGFINVEPGFTVVTASLGQERPIARPTSLIVRAGWLTGVRIIPGVDLR